MFTRDVKTFKTVYDFIKGLDSLFFLYVFVPLLTFSISYLSLNNKKTGIAPSKEISNVLIISIIVVFVLSVVWEYYTYYQEIKEKLKTTKKTEISYEKEYTTLVYDEHEEEEIEKKHVQIEKMYVKDLRELLVIYRKIGIKLYQKHCIISLAIVGVFAYTNLAIFGYVYGALVVIISIEKPTIPRIAKKMQLTKVERDYLIEGNELPA